VCAIAAFIIRELLAAEPILDLTVFQRPELFRRTICIALVALGMNSSMLLVALYAQKILAWDAWNAGLVLRRRRRDPDCAHDLGRLVARTDQRLMLVGGCLLNAVSATMMSGVTLSMDYWSLAWPRFLQGFAMGFVFPPLQTLTLATIPRGAAGQRDRCLQRRAQHRRQRGRGTGHDDAGPAQPGASDHPGHPSERLGPGHGGEAAAVDQPFRQPRAPTRSRPTAGARHALPRHRRQAQVMAYADDFWLISVLFMIILPLIPLMHRVRTEQNERARERPGRVEALPSPDNSPIAPERGLD